MKRTSRQKVYDVIALLKAGLSVSNIASRTGVSKSSVSRIKKQYNIATYNRAMGRPKKFRIITLRYLLHLFEIGRATTASRAAIMLQDRGLANVTSDTVRRALKKGDFKSIIKKKEATSPEASQDQALTIRPKTQGLVLG
jgi:transposase